MATTTAAHTCTTHGDTAEQTPAERLAGLRACLAAALGEEAAVDEHGGDVDQLAAMAANLDGPRPRTTRAARPRVRRTPRQVPAHLAAAIAAAEALPVFDRAHAPVEDFTCALSLPHGGQDVPVEFVEELVPSGMHHKVRCAQGHVTNGVPVRRYRSSSVTAG